jgi:hypothetical protein
MSTSPPTHWSVVMRTIIGATVLAVLPTLVVAAELPKRTTSAPPREVTTNPCAAYGAGFVRVEGTTTCVKVGSTVRVEAGRSK